MAQVTIRIDPDGFQGPWDVDQSAEARDGDVVRASHEEVSLEPGDHKIHFRETSAVIEFRVDASRQVVSASPESAAGGDGILTFLSSAARIRVESESLEYRGSWCIPELGNVHQRGSKDVVLVKGLPYKLQIADDWFSHVVFRLDPEGKIRPCYPEQGAPWEMRLEARGKTLQFLLSPVCFAMDRYPGSWHLGRGLHGAGIVGEKAVALVPGTQYRFRVGHEHARLFELSTDGSLAYGRPSKHDQSPSRESFYFEGGCLVPIVRRVPLHPEDVNMEWCLALKRDCVPKKGARAILLVPGFDYVLHLGTGASERKVGFRLDPCGVPRPAPAAAVPSLDDGVEGGVFLIREPGVGQPVEPPTRPASS